MEYRRFGRTGLQMPVFSCGGMRYQDGWQDKPLDEIDDENQRNLEATIRRALELGINHIETARGYGPSERQLGQILPKLPRDQIIVQTKIGPHDDPKQFIADFEDSLGRLNLDHVDLLAIHGINNRQTLEQSIRDGGCFEAMQKLREQGKCRYCGFSTHGPTDVIVKAIEHGEPEIGGGFDYVNLHWYYIFQRNWPAIEAATERDMGVFIISPSDKGGKLYDPPRTLVELCKPLHPIVFNDLFCLAHEQVHTLSVGASRPTDFDLHLKALAYLPHWHQVLVPIVERLEERLKEKIEPELIEPFHLDLPEPDESPGGIAIATILWLRNLAKAYDMVDYAKMRYNLLGNGGHWFAGQPASKLEEVDLSPVLEPFSDAVRDKIVAALREAEEMLAGEARQRLSESEGESKGG